MAQIQQFAEAGRVQFTLKALRELVVLDLGLDETDVCEMLCGIQEQDFRERIISSVTGECLYVFSPNVAGVVVYLKVVLRSNCVVISFHEDVKHES